MLRLCRAGELRNYYWLSTRDPTENCGYIYDWIARVDDEWLNLELQICEARCRDQSEVSHLIKQSCARGTVGISHITNPPRWNLQLDTKSHFASGESLSGGEGDAFSHFWTFPSRPEGKLHQSLVWFHQTVNVRDMICLTLSLLQKQQVELCSDLQVTDLLLWVSCSWRSGRRSWVCGWYCSDKNV